MPIVAADIVTETLRGEPGVVAAYLFGSHAAGRAHRESDVDVAILLDRGVYPTDRARFEARLLLITRVGAAVAPAPADVIVLNDASPILGRAIVYEGRQLFCRDPETLHAFVRDTLLRAADLEPFLKRMRRLTLDAIAP